MKKIKRIGVLTSGGDAPGMNAAVRAVVRTATYNDIKSYGIHRGYTGMINGTIEQLGNRDVGNIIHRGGTVLKTARSEEFRTKEGRNEAYETINAHDIDACIVIGGDGTLTGANYFCEEFGVPMIGIPGTIDNDLYGSDYTIGFDTAVNTAIEAVDRIRDTADSHNRLFFIEVMGRNSGFIALNTGIGSGAGGVLIPEHEKSIENLVNLLNKSVRRKKLFSLVIVAEGNKSGGATEVARLVKEKLPSIETKVTIIGHLQRGGSPTAADRVLATRLGYEAVNALVNGAENKMVGIVNGNPAYTDFSDAISKVKEPSNNLITMAEILSL